MLSVTSINLNGIRAAQRKGFSGWVKRTNPDILCLQELRALENQIPPEVTHLAYHSYYHTAVKKGYSGVGILSKQKPLSIQTGIGVDWIDEEGRVLMAEFDNLWVCSVYAPSGTTGDVRQRLKMEFLDHFYNYSISYLKDDKPVLFCGDFNICHKAIDIHNPKRNKNTSGFLPEERQWVTHWLDAGFEDIYRCLHQGEPDLYSWWSYRAASKSRNKGWRIDYHIASPGLLEKAGHARIEKEMDLSDHAPVTVRYNI